MASSNNSKKRIKQIVSGPRFVNTRGHLKAWFASESEETSNKSIDAYLTAYNRKIINTPKFIRLDWLKEQQLRM